MIATRRRNHARRRHCARQHIRERAARLERSGVLQQLEFENDPDRLETEVRAVDFDDRSAPDMWPDNALGFLDSLPRKIGCLSHWKQYSRKVAKTQRKC